MTCAPLLPSVSSLLLFSLLSCATAPGISAASLPQDPAGSFEPIRFGDDEAHAYPVPLLPGTDYDPSLPTPDALLGQPWGSRLASHDEILSALTTWADASPRATLAPYGQTHEGRDLVRLVITSEQNQARLREIQDGLLSLSDPRGLSQADGRRLVEQSPAMAWMGYSIHGDETSGSDCAPLLAYHLIACRDADVSAFLDDVVVVLDPCLNPDGRERIRAMTRWNSGYQSNLDHASMHRGRWPYGRGNHYLFDMNRDWMAGVCPETRGRWAVLREFKPQLFVDGHEMGAMDTFLFYPQSKPHNPQLSQKIIEWQGVMADDAARAFDSRGWAYYTREWADAWYPGYSDAWGSLNGAIGMLYEQAGLGGQSLKRASGRVVTYRESVHHQLVASLSNLSSLAANRAAILADYLEQRRGSVDSARSGSERAFAFQDTNPARTRRFLESMLGQGIEVWSTDGESQVEDVVRASGERAESQTLPAGTYLIPSLQPQARLVHAYLDFDPRIDEETVLDERERLERGQSSRLYDVTAWDLARQLDLDALWCTPADGPRTRVQNSPATQGAVLAPAGARPYAWAVDAADDRCLAFAARALDLGLQLHVADREFQFSVTEGGQARTLDLGSGSLLLRRHENPEDVDELIGRAALASGVRVWATDTGRATGEDPDLGGQHFKLLARPRVALLSGNPVSSSDFGHLWHYLDVELGMPVSLLEASGLGSYDLRRYNVIVIPPARGIRAALESQAEALRAWVRSGGTLVACGSAAGGITGEALKLTSVVRRRDALKDLEGYEFLAKRHAAARSVEVDYEALWSDPDPDTAEEPADAKEKANGEAEEESAADPDAERQDAWMRRFAPAGVLLRAEVDERSWLTTGAGAELPVFFQGSTVLLSRGEVPVRLASEDRLRLAGLLWPESRDRIADTAWLAREGVGHGQVILFATHPVFRGSFHGMARLFGNAVVLGPGLGARQPTEW